MLLHEHLLSWVPRLTARVTDFTDGPYAGWAVLAARLLAAELADLGPPVTEAAHFREAPTLATAMDEGIDAFIAAVLAPLRSGLVLARTDLGRAADEFGLGLRIGERAFTLRALLTQDGVAVASWLAGEARRQSAHVRDDATSAGTFWRARLEATALLLDEATLTRRSSATTPRWAHPRRVAKPSPHRHAAQPPADQQLRAQPRRRRSVTRTAPSGWSA